MFINVLFIQINTCNEKYKILNYQNYNVFGRYDYIYKGGYELC